MIYNYKSRVGVANIERIFSEDFKWIFREQPVNDFGIDALVEITRHELISKCEIPTGKLLGIQIKSGQSYFKEPKEDHFVYRGASKHLGYWLNHSLPVILIVYDDDRRLAYWQEVNSSTVILTKKSFKIKISKKNLLNTDKKEALINIAFFKDSRTYKFWQLQTSIHEIRLLFNSQLFLYVEIDSIPNSGEYNITLVVSDCDVEDCYEIIYNWDDKIENHFEYRFRIKNDENFTEAINDVLPWVDIMVDGLYCSDILLIDKIANEYITFEYDELTKEITEIQNSCSVMQIACYISGTSFIKLELNSNKLSYAFLEVVNFLNKPIKFKTNSCL